MTRGTRQLFKRSRGRGGGAKIAGVCLSPDISDGKKAFVLWDALPGVLGALRLPRASKAN